MRVLGVDPGLARTGVALVDGSPGHLRLLHAGCLETGAATDGGARLVQLFAAVEQLVAEQRPQAAAVEELFFATNRRSAMRVSEARGVILCALARAGITVAAYTPLQVKEAVAGYGGATKPQVARMTRALLGSDVLPGPDDVSDACAVAVCHHHRRRLSASIPRGVTRSGRPTAELAAAIDRAQRAATA
jgi:crossover junction endodeoxyribonuclease RuvC